MRKETLTKDSYAYIYDDIEDFITAVFVIIRAQKVFIIDTYCGSLYMEEIMQDLESLVKDKEVIIINTHYHWDHTWGNYYFRDTTIISHIQCVSKMQEMWDPEIKKYGKYFKGEQILTLPNKTIVDSLLFEEEKIYIFHSPGHSIDCITIYDELHKILYVGDNVEKPNVLFTSSDFNLFQETLRKYLTMDVEAIHGSHTLHLTKQDVIDTIAYLEQVKQEINGNPNKASQC